MSERKATEVVLNVEQEILNMKSYLRNLDNNVKIMLSRLNELMSIVKAENVVSKPIPSVQPVVDEVSTKPKIPPGPQPQGPKTFEDLKHTNRFEEAMSKYGVKDDSPVKVGLDNQQSFSNAPLSPPASVDDDPGLVEETVRKGQQRVQRVATSPGSRVSVSQKILAESGTPVHMAYVEIFDSNNQLIKQTRTNLKGTWSAALEPGPYSIHISKREFGPTKKAVELRYDVSVNPTSKPVELESPVGIEG